eukprot:CAMPEP_0173277720 /NCGR_PEP_ID=MMETSP1143-20121109/4233_1 /TAXON_ID=483371 /ORGANISM="non described non described, Strain CCMP2298" /LENGTH=105 /DNA_ID=CAMNT_0014214835 /DNA_START=374 /DNA_END=687 /DNA_ORIENTATION=+
MAADGAVVTGVVQRLESMHSFPPAGAGAGATRPTPTPTPTPTPLPTPLPMLLTPTLFQESLYSPNRTLQLLRGCADTDYLDTHLPQLWGLTTLRRKVRLVVGNSP